MGVSIVEIVIGDMKTMKKLDCINAILIVLVCLMVAPVLAGDSFYDGPNVKVVEQSLAKIATPVATANANGGTNVVVVTLTDLKGDAKAAKTLVRVWISDTAAAAGSAVAGDFAVSGGVELQQIVDKADYWVVTAAAGTVTLTITDTPGMTNYLNTAVGGGVVTSAQMLFVSP